MKQLGSQIKKIREFKNLTQNHVANKLGMSQSNYARIEGDHVSLTESQLNDIADVFEINVSSIKHFDERITISLNTSKEFNPDPNQILHFYQKLSELYKEEINLLSRKITLLESISNN